MGKPIIDPVDIKKIDYDIILIGSQFVSETEKFLSEYKIPGKAEVPILLK